MVSEAAKLIAFRGTFNIVSNKKLDGPVMIDAGRMHYHYTTYLGNSSSNIASSYGEKRNRCDLKSGGVLVVVGGAELFTGNNLIIIAVLDKKVKWTELLKSWIVVYFGNFVGSIILALFLFGQVHGGLIIIL